MQAASSQCKLINRGVTCILLDSLKINLAASFWINCKGLIELAARPAKRALQWTEQELEQGVVKHVPEERACLLDVE